jgi:hypothetical protein
MPEETNGQQIIEANASENALTEVNSSDLSVEAAKILNEIIAETDISKTKDLTYLFNLNQTKKTMIRVNKQSELLDALTEQTIKRVKDKPDELSNEDLTRLMKTVSDLIDKGVGQINRGDEAPLIQFNQQNNDINMDGNSGLSRESRDKVKNAVMNLLKNMASTPADGAIDADSTEGDNY